MPAVDLHNLSGVEEELDDLREEAYRLAVSQLEARVANLEEMHQARTYDRSDWYPVVKEAIFALVCARIPPASLAILTLPSQEACSIVARGDRGVAALVRRVESVLAAQTVDNGLRPYFRRRRFAVRREADIRTLRAAFARLELLRARAQAIRYILTRAGPAHVLASTRTDEATSAVDALTREIRRDLGALEATPAAPATETAELEASLVSSVEGTAWYGMPELTAFEDGMFPPN